MVPMEVMELGDDGEAWLILNCREIAEARLAVIQRLRETLSPLSLEDFSSSVARALDASSFIVDEMRIFYDEERDSIFVESPVGGAWDRTPYRYLGRNGVVLGVKPQGHWHYLGISSLTSKRP